MSKYVYLFKEGDASMRNLLGGKGANLAEMSKIGLRASRLPQPRSLYPLLPRWKENSSERGADIFRAS